jgi:hypothetical protein
VQKILSKAKENSMPLGQKEDVVGEKEVLMHIYSSLPYLFIKPRIILIVWNFKIARFEITYLNEHQD